MDAGFTLARAHYTKLVILWMGFSLPVFLFCVFIQVQLGWSLMLFVWWWFKPLYELPVTFYLSRALFSEPLSIRAAWKMTLSQLGKQFTTYLTFARLSTARSMTAGVVFLEQLPRQKRATRISTLMLVPTRHLVLLLSCLHIEIIISYALITVIGGLFLSEYMADIDWEAVILFASESQSLTAWVLTTSFTTFVAAALVAPFFVSGGFLIYINRRMQLEAWDIEHRFRRINPRGVSAALSVLLVCVCLITSEPTIAVERAQALKSPTEVAVEVQEILAQEDFGATKTRKVPKFKDDGDDDDDEPFDTSWLDWMGDGSASSFAGFMKVLLWLMIAVFAGLLIYTVLQFKQPNLKRANSLSRTGRDGEDAKSHPLTQNLPLDIVASAEQLLQRGERRQALSILFRGALRAVMEQYDLKVSRGATESDCKLSVSSVATANQQQTFVKLMGIWQKEAYANQPQQEQTIASLIKDWNHAFTGQPKPKIDQVGDT